MGALINTPVTPEALWPKEIEKATFWNPTPNETETLVDGPPLLL